MKMQFWFDIKKIFYQDLNTFSIVSDFIVWDSITLKCKICYNDQFLVIYRNTVETTQISLIFGGWYDSVYLRKV